MILELTAFLGLATTCAPGVAPETLAAIARAESGFNVLAINLNGAHGGTQSVGGREEAIALATELVVVRGRSVDLGLMQVNSTNLSRLGLTIADAFDPCRSLEAGARVLAEGYAAAARGEADPQRALRTALSRYNTGHPERGFANGYVGRIEASAERVVPAIRLRGEASVNPTPPVPLQTPASPAPSGPPAWDVFGQAQQARQHVYLSGNPTPSPLPVQNPTASVRTATASIPAGNPAP
ncbi:lytic transglycosylase domain-containing protein [Falsiroseomonas tokyonensis]|uniref:Lytic transglycosylase domain-containing protein n=1 Tax=Falsiroseomonas tokyonensis TaxID=430521 RepID=A0ABV7C1Q7_9PROT|nr:lytic transglycosylase domain-containing protein [Falsiroseomonas tokyonensis]MBU8541730.1 lytic transglycosylase domain-containing protein [Falsiroseomonas tokyonensis]